MQRKFYQWLAAVLMVATTITVQAQSQTPIGTGYKGGLEAFSGASPETANADAILNNARKAEPVRFTASSIKVRKGGFVTLPVNSNKAQAYQVIGRDGRIVGSGVGSVPTNGLLRGRFWIILALSPEATPLEMVVE